MPPVHAIFDFDDTLLAGDSILYWLAYYYRHRPARRIFLAGNWLGLVLYLLRLADNDLLKRIFLLPMAYEDPATLERLARGFAAEALPPAFHPEVLRRLRAHQALGHRVIIVSASASFYLRHLDRALPGVRIEGTEMRWPARGLWRLPRMEGGNLKGTRKIERLEGLPGVSRELSFGYSDHHSDRPLLEWAEFPVCVGPTPKLARLAAERGWTVLPLPAEGPRWRRRLGQLRWLLWPAGHPPARPDGAGGGAAADLLELGRLVSMKYPRERFPEAHARAFGA